MTLTEEEIKRLFRIRKTVMQMLKDRGYFVGDFEIKMTREQFESKYGNNMKREDLVINKTKRNDSSDQVILFILLFYFFINSSFTNWWFWVLYKADLCFLSGGS